MSSYPIIANCNFESRDDATGKAIHAARKAVESGLTADAALVAALDDLEATLEEHADSQYESGVRACREAEAAVEAAYGAARTQIEDARDRRAAAY